MKEKKHNSFKLRDFRGIDPTFVTKLAACGIKNVDQMLAAGCTRAAKSYPG